MHLIWIITITTIFNLKKTNKQTNKQTNKSLGKYNKYNKLSGLHKHIVYLYFALRYSVISWGQWGRPYFLFLEQGGR